MTRLTDAIALLAIAGTVALAVTVGEREVVIERSALDPRAVAYRFPVAPEGDVAAEITALEQRTAHQPQAVDLADLAALHLRRAQRTASFDDYARAERLANQSLELMPEPSSAPLVLARVASARHEFREAIALAKDVAAKTGSTDAYTVLATAYLAIGDLYAAAEAAETAATRKPSTAAYVMRALVMEAQGRDAEAAYDYAHAVAIEAYGDARESARARVLWGRFVLRRGDAASAVILCDAALKILPDDPLALAIRAEAALRTGHAREARAQFDEAFTASHAVRYLMDQVRAAAIAGDAAGAQTLRTEVERLVRNELAQHGFGHRLDLVEILVDRGRPEDLEEAIALGREEVSRRPAADPRFQLARAYARAGYAIDAQLQIRAALALGTRDARLYELAAQVENALGNHARAALYAAEAVKMDPGGTTWRTYGISIGKPRSAL